MHDQPEPTPEEEEQVPEQQEDHEAMRYPGHEDPAAQRPVRERGPVAGDGGNGEVPPASADTQEVHDA
jgi:hypothetical protein